MECRMNKTDRMLRGSVGFCVGLFSFFGHYPLWMRSIMVAIALWGMLTSYACFTPFYSLFHRDGKK